MSRNPYADQMDYEPVPTPSRVSMLAVASLVFGIVCCIPGAGLVALVLGGAGMMAIGRSDGRLAGRGMAIAGLVLGLLGTLWTALVGVGAVQLQSQVRYFASTYSFVEQGDVDRLRTMMTPAAAQQLTPEHLAEFKTRVSAAWGGYLGAPQGLGPTISAYRDATQLMDTHKLKLGREMPVPMFFDKGTAPAMIVIDPQQTAPRGNPAIENMAVFDQNKNPIWLLPQAGGSPIAPTPPPSPLPPAPPAPSTPPTEEPG